MMQMYKNKATKEAAKKLNFNVGAKQIVQKTIDQKRKLIPIHTNKNIGAKVNNTSQVQTVKQMSFFSPGEALSWNKYNGSDRGSSKQIKKNQS